MNKAWAPQFSSNVAEYNVLGKAFPDSIDSVRMLSEQRVWVVDEKFYLQGLIQSFSI